MASLSPISACQQGSHDVVDTLTTARVVDAMTEFSERNNEVDKRMVMRKHSIKKRFARGGGLASWEKRRLIIWHGRRRRLAFLRQVLVLVLISPLGSFGQLGPATEPAPKFTFTLYNGEAELGANRVNLSDLRGKPVILNFWAALCPPCRAEMPEFERFYKEFKDRVRVIGIDVGQFTGLGSQDEARRLLGELGITYPTGYAEDDSVLRAFRVFAMPTTIFINAKGEIIRRWNGVLSRETLTAVTTKMLKQ